MCVRPCLRVPPSTPHPLKTTCTSPKRDITAAADFTAFQFSAVTRTMKKQRRFASMRKARIITVLALLTLSFSGCANTKPLRGACAIFAGNGHDRACTKHRAAGKNGCFCFGQYRDFRRKHDRTRNRGNKVRGFTTRQRGNAADCQQHYGICPTEGIRPRTTGSAYGNTAAGAFRGCWPC